MRNCGLDNNGIPDVLFHLLGRLLFFWDKARSLSALRSRSVRCVPGYVPIDLVKLTIATRLQH